MSADLHHLAAAYALDALDDIERREFENHYPSCEICTAEVQEFRAVAASLALSTATAAPASLKPSVMAEISQTRQLSPLTNTQSIKAPRFSSRVLLAAAAALLVLAGVVAVTLPGSTGNQVNEIVSASDAIATPLDVLVDDQDGTITIFWSDDLAQVVVEASELSDPGPNMQYVLWSLVDGGAAPVGRFLPDNDIVNAVLAVDQAPTAGWGISIEADDSELVAPTDPVIFAGTF